MRTICEVSKRIGALHAWVSIEGQDGGGVNIYSVMDSAAEPGAIAMIHLPAEIIPAVTKALGEMRQ